MLAATTFSPGQLKVGTVCSWPAVDNTKSRPVYLKEFTLRALGSHVEIWVASGADSVSTGLGFRTGTAATPILLS